MLQTSDLLMKMDLSAVLALGDLQYEDGTLDKFQRSYDPTWGRLKAQTRPAVGNHEYRTPGAAGYFDYFNGPGVADGPAGPRDKGYYSYDLGTWHVVALNSQCSHPTATTCGDCAAGSPQEQWLRADLAAHPTRCTLAYWHHPLLQLRAAAIQQRASSRSSRRSTTTAPTWCSPATTTTTSGSRRWTPAATATRARGIRQFVVGTGGKSHTGDRPRSPTARSATTVTYGVLKLTLRPAGYGWEYVTDRPDVFDDSGANACH